MKKKNSKDSAVTTDSQNSNNSKPSSGSSSNSKSSGGSNNSTNKPSGNTGSSTNKPSNSTSTKPSESHSSNSDSNSGSSSTPTQKPTQTPTQQPTKPAHQHNYTSSVTTQPTCSTNGVRTYKCSCGDSYTESIPATGNHSWQDIYETQTIPAKTHTEDVWKVVCNGCGAQFDTADEAGWHVMEVFGDECENYSSKIVDTKVVVDVPEQTKQVFIGTQCSVCGAWK